MKYRVVYGESVRREIRRLDKAVQKRIHAAANALGADPRPPGCRKMIGYSSRWRIRVGDYRVVYDVHDDIVTIHVAKVGHRSDIYR